MTKIRRKPSTLIKLIVSTLREEPISLRRLDIKLNTSSRSVQEYTKLLQDLGIVAMRKIRKGGNVITAVGLTKYGTKLRI